MISSTKLIIGIGNIGAHFEGTRHNTGFMLVDALATQLAADWATKDKFKSLIAEQTKDGQKIILLKPTTYYNLSGEAARTVKDFYKIHNENILVIHDELALPFGTVRARIGGSDAGNNGLKSIIAHIGADVARVRVGIANQQLATIGAADFVLAKFNHDEHQQWPAVQQQALQLVHTFLDPIKKFEHTSVRV